MFGNVKKTKTVNIMAQFYGNRTKIPKGTCRTN